ncbi:MAG: SCO family protein [Gammaproteobacteria bacterium]
MAIATVVAVNSTAESSPIPEALRDVLVDKPVTLPSFHLTDQQGNPLDPSRFKNAWTFLFFGYTHCPDVCPTTLTELDNAAGPLKSANKTGNKIQYVFISVDPDRDTPKSIGDYVSYFESDFIAATGSKKQLTQLATPLHIKFKRGIGTDTDYIVNHSSAMLLIDPQARYYARLRAPHYAEEIVNKFKQIINYRETL